MPKTTDENENILENKLKIHNVSSQKKEDLL